MWVARMGGWDLVGFDCGVDNSGGRPDFTSQLRPAAKFKEPITLVGQLRRTFEGYRPDVKANKTVAGSEWVVKKAIYHQQASREIDEASLGILVCSDRMKFVQT